jgi:hypothetical protein
VTVCYGCFSEHWEGRDPVEFWLALPDERKKLIQLTHFAISETPGVTPDWVGGPMHALIDDDNYDCECFGFGERGINAHRRYGWELGVPLEWALPCTLWKMLSEDERSIVVSARHNYPNPATEEIQEDA